MALQVCNSAPIASLPHNSPAIIAAAAKQYRRAADYPQLMSRRRLSLGLRTKASSEEAEAVAVAVTVAVAGEVTEVSKDTFWPIVKAAGAKIVVLDMYTQWCGPCKVIAPKYKELSEKHEDIVFLKLDCNQQNKALAKELGCKVVPTFKILKDGKVVKEVTGAKFHDLVHAIQMATSTST